ncbi:MAG: hypothetical protein V1691_03610 [Chloroflexota bacterium]
MMSQRGSKARVALKYCGSCNPQVELSRIGGHLARLAGRHGGFQMVPLSEDEIDVVVILCGCPRACGNKAEFRERARWSLVIAGASLGGQPVPEADLPGAVELELLRMLGQRR